MSLMPSGGGVFEVIVDGALVFSKKALGRHAEDGEVLPLVSAELFRASSERASSREPGSAWAWVSLLLDPPPQAALDASSGALGGHRA